MKTIKISNNEIPLNDKPYIFPKYVESILNVINQGTQATKIGNVGEITKILKEFQNSYRTFPGLSEWIAFYDKKMPNALFNATLKILDEAKAFNISKIDIANWAEDLIYIKPYRNLLYKELILQKISKAENMPYKLSTIEEENRGCSGWLGEMPVVFRKFTSFKELDKFIEFHDLTQKVYECDFDPKISNKKLETFLDKLILKGNRSKSKNHFVFDISSFGKGSEIMTITYMKDKNGLTANY